MTVDTPSTFTLERPSVWGSVTRVGRLARKELSEIFRDRRTIITLVLMPLLLYPLLSFAFRQFLIAFASAPDIDRPYRLGVESNDEKRFVEIFLARSAKFDPLRLATVIGQEAPPTLQPFGGWGWMLSHVFPREPNLTIPSRYDTSHFGGKPHPPVEIVVKKNVQMALAKGELDAVVKVHAVGPGVMNWELYYPEQALRSIELAAYVEQRCALASFRQNSILLQQSGLHINPAPVQVFRYPLEPESTGTSLSLTAMVPLILILMTITGAVYPAIDLTAGERERGTLEILVAAPVPRMALLFAKYVAVVVVAMLTATVNLGMMLVTLEVNGLTNEVFRQSGVTVQLVLQLLFLLILFAAFFSAVLLALTSFARSFKEAQAYLIPLMLASLGPGVIGMMPGLKLEGLLRVTPLVNIVLLARDLPDGALFSTAGIVVVASTLVYAVAAITVAAWIFGAEAVLYSEQSSWSDLFRRPKQMQPAATLTGALFGLALLVPAMFLVQSVAEVNRAHAFAWQVFGSIVLFAGLPLFVCLGRRVQLRSGLQLHQHSLLAIPAVVCLGIGAAPLVLHALVGMQALGLTLISAAQLQRLADVLQGQVRHDPLLVAGGFAFIGAAEELFYRGFLFSSLRARYGQWTTILVSALLFGAMHAVVKVDALIHSTLLGVLLGWVAWRMRSVVPGMILHATVNATLAYISENGIRQTPVLEGGPRQRPRLIVPNPLEAIPDWLDTWAVPLFLTGLIAIWWLGRQNVKEPPPDAAHSTQEAVGIGDPSDRSAHV
jgi:sodium transport system permease protein